MAALDLLKSQHRAIESLLDRILAAGERDRLRLSRELADLLAVHAVLEERHVHLAPQPHVAVNRGVLDLLRLRPGTRAFEAHVRRLRRHIQRHIAEEEQLLFPRIERLLDAEALARDMAATSNALESHRRALSSAA